MSRTVHICLDVAVALKNGGSSLTGFTHPDGRVATKREVREYLIDELVKGHKVIPFGGPCEGFDYGGGGCPGHEETAEP